MIRTILTTALLSAAATLAAVYSFGAAAPTSRLLLENARVKVSEISYPAGAARPRGVRPADQVIVFLDDCRYERTDPASGEKTVRQRKSGDVIWHAKGEDAPLLVNAGSRPYRTILIELK